MPSADPGPAPAGESAAARFCQRLRLALQGDSAITEKRMFGATALCADGKVFLAGGQVFLFPWKDAPAVKLPAPQAGQLVASGDAVLSGHGRTSKTWAAVSAQARGRWERLAQDARAFAAG